MIYFSLPLSDLEKVSRSNPETLDLVPTIGIKASGYLLHDYLYMLRLFLRLNLIYNLIIKSKIKILDQSQAARLSCCKVYPLQCKGCPSLCRSIFNHKFIRYDLD